MKIDRRMLIASVLPMLLTGLEPSRADDPGSWDGAWKGMLGKKHPWPITVTIAQGKVVKYTENGAPFDIKFTDMTPTTVSFGDEEHYSVTLTKTGETKVSAKVHSRQGFGTGSLIKG
jgi:hypothetical protein